MSDLAAALRRANALLEAAGYGPADRGAVLGRLAQMAEEVAVCLVDCEDDLAVATLKHMRDPGTRELEQQLAALKAHHDQLLSIINRQIANQEQVLRTNDALKFAFPIVDKLLVYDGYAETEGSNARLKSMLLWTHGWHAHWRLSPPSSQEGQPSAAPAPSSSQEGQPSAAAAPSSSQEGQPSAAPAPSSGQEGQPSAAPAPNSSLLGGGPEAAPAPISVAGRERGLIKCMLSGAWLPAGAVVATHIVKRKWAKYGVHEMMGITRRCVDGSDSDPDHEDYESCCSSVSEDDEEVDSPANGLLLFKPFQHAFDRSWLCFVYDSSKQEYVMHVLRPAARSMRLVDVLRGHRLLGKWAGWASDARVVEGVGDRTFADYEGRSLHLPGLAGLVKRAEDVLRRALLLHAGLARERAVRKRWIGPDELLLEDFLAEGDSECKVRAWLESQHE